MTNTKEAQRLVTKLEELSPEQILFLSLIASRTVMNKPDYSKQVFDMVDKMLDTLPDTASMSMVFASAVVNVIAVYELFLEQLKADNNVEELQKMIDLVGKKFDTKKH